MKKDEHDICLNCGTDLISNKRYPVYSSRLAVLGYRCGACHEKSKSPQARKREEEISRLTKELPQLENNAQNTPA